jgi:hypothetical protein
MYLARIFVALILCVDLPLLAAVEAQGSRPPIAPQESPPARSQPPLLADCTETRFLPSPPRRPPRRRATHASKPHAHHVAGKKIARKKAVHRRRHAAAGPSKRPRRSAHRRAAPLAKHVVLRRVTYASPLCDKRTPFINDMIGLPDNEYAITQAPVPADTTIIAPTVAVVGPAGPDTLTSVLPYTPLYPLGPGPIILAPVGPAPPVPPPVGPPVTPPVTTSPIPEPASWTTLIFGMTFAGGLIRRHRATIRHRV